MARGSWLVALFIICKPVMSTLDNRNELISGCRHSKKFLLNTVLTWLVLVANLTCCKHRSLKYDAPRPYATPGIYCFVLPDDSPRKRHDSLSSNKCSRYNPVPSVYFYYIHTYIQLYQEAKINAVPTPINNRTVHAQEHVKCHIACN